MIVLYSKGGLDLKPKIVDSDGDLLATLPMPLGCRADVEAWLRKLGFRRRTKWVETFGGYTARLRKAE